MEKGGVTVDSKASVKSRLVQIKCCLIPNQYQVLQLLVILISCVIKILLN